MNKHFVRNSLIFASTVLSLPLLLWSGQSGLPSKTITGEVTDSICAPSGSHTATMAKSPSMGTDSQTCTKKCVAMGAKYVLYDEATRTMYSVDDQGKLEPFAGQKVSVTGIVTGNAIKVSNVRGL